MTTRLPRTATLLLPLLVLVAMVAAGCGDASKSQYQAGLRKVQKQLNAASEPANEGDLKEAQARIEQAAKTADTLDPPSDVRKAHAKLAAALHDYADVFGKLAAMPDNDPDRGKLYGEAGKIVARLDEANRAIEKAGYAAKKPSGQDSK